MENLDLFKELYYKENERKHEVQNALSIPITAIPIISSGLFYLQSNFYYQQSLILTILFVSLLLIAYFSVIVALCFLIGAYGNFGKGYDYKSLAYVDELYRWKKQLKIYYEEYGLNDDSDSQFRNILEEQMVNCTNVNMKINDLRLKFLVKSKFSLFVALVISLVTIIPFGIGGISKPESVQKIQIIK